jgi:hypothetical protein
MTSSKPHPVAVDLTILVAVGLIRQLENRGWAWVAQFWHLAG